MRKHIKVLFTLGVVACLSVVTSSFLSELYPRFLTSSYMRCFTFFSLDNVPLVLVDELYSQGEDVFAFGEKIYFWGGLNEEQLTTLSRYMIEKGGIETNGDICLVKKRHEIVGKFKLSKDPPSIRP